MYRDGGIIIVILIVFCRFTGLAQTDLTKDMATQDIVSVLPTLENLIDSAIVHNQNVRFRELQIRLDESKLKSERTYWTRNIGFQTDVRYGTFNNFSTNTAEGQNPDLLASRSNQTNYGVGAYMKFPLYDFFNRKSQINQAKIEIEQAESLAESQKNEIRQLVIRQYNGLILSQRLLKNKTQAFETAKINMEMVEKEFKNGTTTVGEYARIYQIVNNAETDLETAKMDFITAYMILEEIVGYILNLNNSINSGNENN
jgi:outer membrane protein TolC